MEKQRNSLEEIFSEIDRLLEEGFKDNNWISAQS